MYCSYHSELISQQIEKQVTEQIVLSVYEES